MGTIWVVLAVIDQAAWLAPSAGATGLELRVRTLDLHQPVLARESLWRCGVAAALVNPTGGEREYVPLRAARESGFLKVAIVRPDGEPLRARRERLLPALDERMKLPARRAAASAFGLDEFGYDELPEPGEYTLRATLGTAGGVLEAPPVKLTACEPAPDAVLVSRPVPLGGVQANWPEEAQERAAVQQITVGGRTFLFYRRFLPPKNGGKVYHAFRLAELPGKVDMTVEGVNDSLSPLTITYKTSPAASPTILVVNSISGRPWTEEEERLRQERAGKVKP